MKTSRMIVIASLSVVLLAATASFAQKAPPRQCKVQEAQGMSFEMCLAPAPAFGHDMYVLSSDRQVLAVLVDDFAESVVLQHTVPAGASIEFPLSRQAGVGNVTQIKGGCAPVSKDGAEVARLCNFQWGDVQIIKDVRFEF